MAKRNTDNDVIVVHHSPKPFFMVNNAPLNDLSLLMEHRWLYVCVCYCQEHNMPSLEELCHISHLPPQTVLGGLNRLSQKGYIEYEPQDDAKILEGYHDK